MKRNVLLITSEDIPRPGEPATGGTLRVHGLAEGLRRHGHRVLLSIPADAVREGDPDELRRFGHVPERLSEVVFEALPDAIIVEQWGLAGYLPDSDIPVAVDLHGPLSLENAFKSTGNFRSDALTKIDALARADVLTVPGAAQKQYFLPWFLFAGADPKAPPILRVPLSMDEDAPVRADKTDPALVFAGSTWPWIDPFPALEYAAKAADAIKGARIDLFVGAPKLASAHPLYDINKNVFADYRQKMAPFASAQMLGLVPRPRLLEAYGRARAAIDLYQPNPERELAYSTRTVEYLWAGLPVITSAFMDLSDDVAVFDAGWIVDPDDEEAVAAAVREALTDTVVAARKSENARRLARERFDHRKAVEPLARWIEEPRRRARGKTLVGDIRDYYRRESVRFVDEARESVTRVNEEMRATALAHQTQLADKERRYDELIRDMRRKEEEAAERARQTQARSETKAEEFQKEIRSLQDEVKALSRQSMESAEVLRRDLTDRYEKEIAELKTAHRDELRDALDRHKSETERNEHRLRELEDELRRTRQEREREAREHEEAVKGLNLRAEEKLVESGRQSEKEIEKRDAELERMRRRLDETREERERETRALNQQIATATQLHDERLRQQSERYEEQMREQARSAKTEVDRRDRHIEQMRERSETTRELLESRMRELEDEKRRLAETRDADVEALILKEREITEMLKSAQKDNEDKDRRARNLAESADSRKQEIERLTKELAAREEAVADLKDESARLVEAHAEEVEAYVARLREEETLRETLRADFESQTERYEAAERDLSSRLDIEIAAKTEAESALGRKDSELEEERKRVRDYQGRLERLHKDFEARFQELDRVLTDREAEMREAIARFEDMERRLGEQAALVSDLEQQLGRSQNELRRTAADLQATVGEYRRLQGDLDKSVRHAADLSSELSTLRHRNALAERILADIHSDERLRRVLRRRERAGKYAGKLPQLAALWGVNLASNVYMEWWQRKKGVQIFPGMKKNGDDRPKPR